MPINRIETEEKVYSERNVASLDATFTRDAVVSQGEKVRIVDADEDTGLELFCYNRCGNEDSEFIKGCRGLVFNGEKLILKGFSYTDEYNHLETSVLTELFSDLNKWTFYTAYEGALLRLFYFSGKWFLSTHRKLNAFRSKWSSRESFGTLFKRGLESEIIFNMKLRERIGHDVDNILDSFQDSLDKTKQYMFLLRNTSDNRIVCMPPKDGEHLLYHVGTFSEGVLSMTDDVGLAYPESHLFRDLEQLVRFVDTGLDIKRHQGVVCFGPDGKQIKVYHKEYQHLFRARGNEPSLKFRYLQVRMNSQVSNILYNLYPDMTSTFDDIENTLYDIARVIYRAYVQRFIKKLYVTVPREEYQVINESHAWHLSDRENNMVTLDKVIEIMNKQPPTNLNHMIRRFRIENSKVEDVTLQLNAPIPSEYSNFQQTQRRPPQERSQHGQGRTYQGQERSQHGQGRTYQGQERPQHGQGRTHQGQERPQHGEGRTHQGQERPHQGYHYQSRGRHQQGQGRSTRSTTVQVSQSESMEL